MPTTDNNNNETSSIELSNENPDIGKAGPVRSSRPKTISLPATPSSSLLYPKIPVGIAGVWHSHKKQGMHSSPANVVIPGSTFAMIVPASSDSDRCNLLIRTDIRDASGMATSTVSVETTISDAMNFLNENFVQTRFQG